MKRFPHGGARFEQAGPFALTRLLRDLDGALGHPSRVLQLTRASQGERLYIRDAVFRGGTLPGRCRRPSEFVLVTRQEGNEILGLKQLGGFQLALRRET